MFDKYASILIAIFGGFVLAQSIFLGIITIMFALVIAHSKYFF